MATYVKVEPTQHDWARKWCLENATDWIDFDVWQLVFSEHPSAVILFENDQDALTFKLAQKEKT